MAGRKVGWPETKRQNTRRELSLCHGKEGRMEGGVGPKKQVWGKAGLALPHLPQPMLALPGAGPGKEQRSRATNVCHFCLSLLTSHSLPLSVSPNSCVDKAGRQTQTNVFADLAHFLTAPELKLNSIHRSFLRDEHVGNRHPCWLGHGAASSLTAQIDPRKRRFPPRHLRDLATWPRADAQQPDSPKDAPNATSHVW